MRRVSPPGSRSCIQRSLDPPTASHPTPRADAVEAPRQSPSTPVHPKETTCIAAPSPPYVGRLTCIAIAQFPHKYTRIVCSDCVCTVWVTCRKY